MTTSDSPDSLSFARLREVVAEREAAISAPLVGFEYWSTTEIARAAAEEADELFFFAKRLTRGGTVDHSHIEHMIADTIIYLEVLSARLGINLGAVVHKRIYEEDVRDRINEES